MNPHNKEMKLTSVESIGRSQLIWSDPPVPIIDETATRWRLV